jgi:FkbM family methyltransferase
VVSIIKLNQFRALFKFAHILVALQNKFVLSWTLVGFKAELDNKNLLRFGTDYGGWWVPKYATSIQGNKVLVSAGLGHDTSFDSEMLRHNFAVTGLDPLIECCTRAEHELAGIGDFEVLNLGISTFTGSQNFFQPKNPSHDSWSTINVQEVVSGEIATFQVISLADLIVKFPTIRDSVFSYLKMDIEGAELAILKDAFSDIKDFDFVGIELDFLSLIPFLALRKRIRGVREARKILRKFEEGQFALVHTENFNFFWEKRIR